VHNHFSKNVPRKNGTRAMLAYHSRLMILGTGKLEPEAAGAVLVDVSELGRDGCFARVLEWARRNYDFVVIDSAPVLSATESQLLARLTDRTVFLVRWSRTPIGAAQRSLKMLANSGAKLAGVTLSMVGKSELAHYHCSSRYARIASAERSA
jgi:Mrp family chromosome partitioning ATPase